MLTVWTLIRERKKNFDSFRGSENIYLRCRTRRNNWVRRRGSPVDAWRRTRSRPRPPDEHGRSSRNHALPRILRRSRTENNEKQAKRDVAVNHTSAPNVKLTPRSFSPQPIVSLSGSDHNKSHNKPWSGTSVGRMMRRICSMDWRSGLRPP